MQKHHLFNLIAGITLLLVCEPVWAGIISLPRYTGEFAYRTVDGGRDKTCAPSYQYSCTGTGYSGGSGASCQDKYQSCVCSADYKWSGGSCVLKGCSDYGYQAHEDTTKSCEEKTPRTDLTCYACTSCDSSTYQYTCTGGLNANEQGTENKCGNNYSECSCVDNAVWNNGKCECKADYKASGSSCVLKTCEDYGYQGSEDTTKDCSKQTPRSGLECWNCSSCTGTLYDCSSITNANGADTSSTSCGGKYAKCKCKDLYVWDSGSCKLSCTRNSCSTTTYPLTAKSVSNAISYEECTPSCSDEAKRYKVASCGSGYTINSSGSGCLNDTCSGNYQTASCSDNQIQTGVTTIASGRNCYTCRAKNCSDGGYVSSCPSGEIGTSVNYAGLSCFKDCKDPCDSVTAVTVPSNASCSGTATSCPSKCTSWSCNSGYTKSGNICVEANLNYNVTINAFQGSCGTTLEATVLPAYRLPTSSSFTNGGNGNFIYGSCSATGIGNQNCRKWNFNLPKGTSFTITFYTYCGSSSRDWLSDIAFYRNGVKEGISAYDTIDFTVDANIEINFIPYY